MCIMFYPQNFHLRNKITLKNNNKTKLCKFGNIDKQNKLYNGHANVKSMTEDSLQNDHKHIEG